MKDKGLQDLSIIIRGGGEMASGVACRLFRANLRRILLLETPFPLAVRRKVSFCEAVHEKVMRVEGVEAVRISAGNELFQVWEDGKIALRVDPGGESISHFRPDVLVDATLAKRNLGTSSADAPLVIALGPGFEAGRDCHAVIETNRGHNLGRIYRRGYAEADTGIPGDISGYTRERVLRAPVDGLFTTSRQIGEGVRQGEVVGRVGRAEVVARIDGILHGLLRPDSHVTCGLKVGDVDPRGEPAYCHTISEKARSLGGAVLETVLAVYNR